MKKQLLAKHEEAMKATLAESMREVLELNSGTLRRCFMTICQSTVFLQQLVTKHHNTQAAAVLDGFTDELAAYVAALHRQRQGRALEGDRAWCASCGCCVVDCSKGTDVCPSCILIVQKRGGFG